MPEPARKNLNARIPGPLHRQVKLLAVKRDVSMEDLVEEALRLVLAQYRKEA